MVDRGHDGVRTIYVPGAVDHLAGVFDFFDPVGDPDDALAVVLRRDHAEHLRAVDLVEEVRVVDAMERWRDGEAGDVFLAQVRAALQVDDPLLFPRPAGLQPGELGIDGTLRRRGRGRGRRLEVDLVLVERIGVRRRGRLVEWIDVSLLNFSPPAQSGGQLFRVGLGWRIDHEVRRQIRGTIAPVTTRPLRDECGDPLGW
jgi:hypothetical protein